MTTSDAKSDKAISFFRTLGTLDEGFVLAPERYDPRRTLNIEPADSSDFLLADLVEVVSDQIYGRPSETEAFGVVFDTSDAFAGRLATGKNVISIADLKSAKKLVRPGDVIISRLRPYLRQIALVDDTDLKLHGTDTRLMVSTEFIVLRSVDNKSIAFMVPLLMSEQAQSALDAAVEGGHHPRFDPSVILKFPIPESLIATRDERSDSISTKVSQVRTHEADLRMIVSSG